MAELPFNIDLIRVLAEHRNGFLTQVSLFFTNLGEIEGYVFLISLLYVTYDKKLAIRLAVLTLLAMSLNHILKTLIMNPRPFISQGDFMDRWAVGWVVGLAIALFAIRYADRISTLWGRFSYGKQVAIVTSSGLILWLATRELSAWMAAGQPYTFLSYMGLLTGTVVSQPLETRMIDFHPRSPSVSRKALRYALSVGMFIAPLLFVKMGLALRLAR